jgi:putative transposase
MALDHCRSRIAVATNSGGVAMNHKKLFRLYQEKRLTVRRCGGRKRVLGTRAPMVLRQKANQRWILDDL